MDSSEDYSVAIGTEDRYHTISWKSERGEREPIFTVDARALNDNKDWSFFNVDSLQLLEELPDLLFPELGKLDESMDRESDESVYDKTEVGHKRKSTEAFLTPHFWKRHCSSVPFTWTDFEKSLLVGIIFTAFTYTGTLAFSGVNSSISWVDITDLFNIALGKLEKPDWNKGCLQLRSMFKAIKAQAKRGNLSLKALNDTWSHTHNKEEILLTSRQFNTIAFGKPTLYGLEGDIDDDLHMVRRNSWTHSQEVVLFGVICDYIFEHGSLHQGSTNAVSPWEHIGSAYSTYAQKLGFHHINEIPRSTHALKRHFKEMRMKQATRRNQQYFRELYVAFLSRKHKA